MARHPERKRPAKAKPTLPPAPPDVEYDAITPPPLAPPLPDDEAGRARFVGSQPWGRLPKAPPKKKGPELFGAEDEIQLGGDKQIYTVAVVGTNRLPGMAITKDE